MGAPGRQRRHRKQRGGRKRRAHVGHHIPQDLVFGRADFEVDLHLSDVDASRQLDDSCRRASAQLRGPIQRLSVIDLQVHDGGRHLLRVREEWKAPGQLPPAETEAAFQRFAAYIDHIRGIPGVRFVTASDLPNLYPDLARRNGLSEAELKQLGQRIVDQAPTGLGAQTVGEKVLSPADQFECLTLAVKQMVDTGMARYPVRPGGLLGPDSPPPAIHHPTEISALAFRDTLRDVENFIRTQNRVPSRVYIGPDSIPPADFLVTVASAFLAMTTQGSFSTNAPFSIPVGITNSLERFIAPDSPSLFGGWIIHREGFRAPRVVEIARLQAWTLKPARRAIEP